MLYTGVTHRDGEAAHNILDGNTVDEISLDEAYAHDVGCFQSHVDLFLSHSIA